MARKESISREGILEAAFALVQSKGLAALTARKLAEQAGCSTQPIFRLFKNMDELTEELFTMATGYYGGFKLAHPEASTVAFVDLGRSHIRFAQENKNIFALLFTAENRYGKTLYDLINGDSGAVSKELAKAKAAGCAEPGDLFMKMWMLIHGAACMSLTGDYDLNEDDTKKWLEDSYAAFV